MSSDNIESPDIQRMINFVSHEANQIIKELHLTGIEEYNSERAKLLKEGKKVLKKNHQKQLEDLKAEFNSKISILKNKKSQEMLKVKRNILKDFFSDVAEKLSKQELCEGLMEEVVRKLVNVNKNKKNYNLIFTVLEKDLKIAKNFIKTLNVKKIFRETINNSKNNHKNSDSSNYNSNEDNVDLNDITINITVKTTKDKNFLGGVIGLSSDTKTIVDNTFSNRIKTVWEKYLGEISKSLGLL